MEGETVVGVGFIVFGLVGIVWALFARTYDDRWSGERSAERFRQFGMRAAPLPMTRRDRIAGVLTGVGVIAFGVGLLLIPGATVT